MVFGEKNEHGNILHALYVLPKFQGRGVGQVLWNSILTFFAPGQDIMLEVFAKNTTAIDFYLRNGFEATNKASVRTDFTAASGVEVEKIEMRLRH
jgi:ribosomal protein S18 acetylase RimI-like enzyme